MFIPFSFQKKQSIMNISVLHNMLVTFFLFKVRHAGQDSTLNDDEYRVMAHILFTGVFLTCSFDKHLAYSVTECISDISNSFIRLSAENVEFSFAIVFYLGKQSCLQIDALPCFAGIFCVTRVPGSYFLQF